MGSKELVNSNVRSVAVSDVIEELMSKSYFEKTIQELFLTVKNKPPYKQMTQVITNHLTNIMVEPNVRVPGKEDRQAKRKQMAEVGMLALSIDSSVREVINEKLKSDAMVTIKRTIQELTDEKTNIQEELEQGSQSPENSPKRKKIPNSKYSTED